MARIVGGRALMPGDRIARLLIANRGEIARRIIRTARRMTIQTVAVYSDADAHAPFVREADMALHIGQPPAKDSYLDAERVLTAARDSGADAVHPGYGFLSENAAFAEAVTQAGLIWVGPPPSAIRAMGLKDAAKALMMQAGVPTTPGYLGADQTPEGLAREAGALGYPVLIKAVAGGGGKGMRRVDEPAAFASALAGAKREAAASFGDDRVLLEIYVARPRHIEVQIFADSHDHVVHLFERDCSLQRRHQKVIEEAPAPGMDEETRAQVTGAAILAARAVGYVGAGTVEFIADGSAGLRGDRIWFMEMNTRLQVEHPVTEMVTGVDLVEWQLRVAVGEPLPLEQDAIRLRGWAMEARLYAENPARKFLPSTGPLTHFRLPQTSQAVRIDSGVEEGGVITPYYDPMIAKIIATGLSRQQTARTLADACAKIEVWPVKTNAGFVVRCLRDEDFVAGRIDTGFIESRLNQLTAVPPPAAASLTRAAQRIIREHAPVGDVGPWSAAGAAAGFRLNADRRRQTRLQVGGETMVTELQPMHPGAVAQDAGPTTADGQMVIFDRGETYLVAQDPVAPPSGAVAGASDGRLISPMPGKIVSVGTTLGAAVTRGQVVVVLEAMKMEHALTAPFAGRITALSATAGDQVSEGIVLAEVKKDD